MRPEANKLEIKNEVEALYNVTVVDVNTIRYACLLYTSHCGCVKISPLQAGRLAGAELFLCFMGAVAFFTPEYVVCSR